MNDIVNRNDNINVKINEYDIIYKNYSKLTSIYNSLVEYNFNNLSIIKEIYNYENLLSKENNNQKKAVIIKKISSLKNKTNYLLVDYDYNKHILKNKDEISEKRSIIKFLEIMYYKKEILKKIKKLSDKYESLNFIEGKLIELYTEKIHN